MKQKEKDFFIALCNINTSTIESDFFNETTPEVLGQLFFNRMQGIAYYVLKKCNKLSEVNREFRASLRGAYEQNIEKNESFFECVEYISQILLSCDCKYAMLKGSYLCDLYPKGCRTSNDIDLLVLPKDVSQIGEKLSYFGFTQGHVKNDEFIPATRKDVIESRMMRGEVVPYVKQVNLPGLKYIEVDINFSLDYKYGEEKSLNELLNNTCKKKVKGFNIITLNDCDFFIHLCAHLYKEATTLPWIEMRRDMTLYKYSDVFLLLNNMTIDDIKKILRRANELGIDKVCAFAILQTIQIFKLIQPAVQRKCYDILKEDKDFLYRVVLPAQNSTMKYKTKNALRRFFVNNRLDNLMEDDKNEKT